MLIKFLDHGTGSARKAADYLLGEKDHTGAVRPEVKVLRGDPRLVAEVADSLDFKNRYTSGVIAFALEDAPTEAQIDELLDDFEKVSYAGVGSLRGSYSAILHREEGGGCHIHIFAARVDLDTGKSFNIAPPGWEQAFGKFKDYYNLKNSWADPDDLSRARLLQPGKRSLIEAARLRQGRAIEPDTKAQITLYLVNHIEHGLIKNRQDVIDSLKDAGYEITRQGRDYISVKDVDSGKTTRLKGALYEEHFSVERALAIAERANAERGRGADSSSIDAARREFEEAVRKRAEYNEKRYRAKRERPAKRSSDDVRADEKIDNKFFMADVDSTRSNSNHLLFDGSRNLAISANRISQSEDDENENFRRRSTLAAQHDSDEMHRRKQLDFVLRRLQKMRSRGVLIKDAQTIYWNFDGRRSAAIFDRGDRLEVAGKVTDAKIRLMIATAIEKKWEKITLQGDRNFQLAAAKEAFRSGIESVTGSNLKESDILKIKKEIENERNKERAAAAAKRNVASVSSLPGVHKLDSLYDEGRTNKSFLRDDASDRLRLERESRRHDSQLLKPSNSGRRRTKGGLNERDRDTIAQTVADVDRRRRESRKRADEASESLAATSKQFDAASRKFDQTNQQLANEIDVFKSQISLTAYAEKVGYSVDARATTADAVVMTRDKDTITIKRVEGRELYAGKENSDRGSIIDFVQRRERMNLGQVRKHLREELARQRQTKTDLTAQFIARHQPSSYEKAMRAISDHERAHALKKEEPKA